MDAIFFANVDELRAWFQEHHASADELWIGMYKSSTGKPSVKWSEVVDQALCFGWIDGIRHRIDDESYKNRLTPRRRGSNWSAVNIKRVEELKALGLMTPAGLAAFEARRDRPQGVYSYETRPHEFPEPYLSRFTANVTAWDFFESWTPAQRRTAIWWVVSARQEETRLKRLDTLIDLCARKQRLDPTNLPKSQSA
jgi:uncharacterized protein YdeI (YjbR/CyaY-like superfamily)